MNEHALVIYPLMEGGRMSASEASVLLKRQRPIDIV